MKSFKKVALIAASAVFSLGLNCIPNVGGQFFGSDEWAAFLASLGITI
jgi:hypothetical protein